MAATSGSPQTTAEDQYRAAIEGYRNVVKWVISAFAAVAAALIASLQLSALGQLKGTNLEWSLVGVTLAFAGVVAIILFAVQVLVPIGATYRQFESSRDFKPLRRYLAKDDAPLRRAARSAPELAQAYDAAIEREKAAREEVNRQPYNSAHQRQLAEATRKREELFEIVVAVTKLGLMLRTQELFWRAMWAIRLGVVAVAAGTILFSYFANPPKALEGPECRSDPSPLCCCWLSR